MERRTFLGTIPGAGLLASQACAQKTAGTEQGVGLRIGFGERPALVVSDFERAFTDPALPLGDVEAEVTSHYEWRNKPCSAKHPRFGKAV